MASELKCPNCGATIRVDSIKKGEAECAECHTKFKVTQKTEEQKIAGLAIDVGLHATAIEAAEEKKSKNCPSCNTELDHAAVICPNCGLNQRSGERMDIKPTVTTERPKLKTLPLVIAVLLVIVSAFMVKRTFFGKKDEQPKPPVVKKEKPAKKKPAGMSAQEAAVAEQERERQRKYEEQARLKEEQRRKNAKNRFEQGEKREKERQWRTAIVCYQESNRFVKNEEALKRVQGVENIINALELVEAKQWDAAIAKFKEAQPNISNKEYVQGRIDYCEKRKQFEALRAESEKLQEEAKWEEAKSRLVQAEEIAQKIERRLLKDLEEDKKAYVSRKRDFDARHERMQYVLSLLDKDADFIALLGACRYYESKPEYRFFMDEIQAKKKIAEEAIKAEKQKPFVTPTNEPVNLVSLKLKDESEVIGKVVSELPVSIKLEIKEGDELKTRFIPTSQIVTREEINLTPAEANEQTARELFVEAIKAFDSDRPRNAAHLAEILKIYFPNQKIAKDAPQQKALIAKTSDAVLKHVGETLNDFEGGCIRALEYACDECEGATVVTCPVCNGTGKALRKCPRCNGKKSIFCHSCGGSGRRGRGGRVKCPTCGARGRMECPDCEGKGEVMLPCLRCKPTDLQVRCPSCAGIGKIECKECGADGRVGTHNLDICPKCKGARRVECPVCKGEGSALVTEWDYTIKCPKCKGGGKRKLPY